MLGPLLRHAILLLLGASFLGMACRAAADEENIVLGILAYRPKPESRTRWQPLADYLARALPGKKVQLSVLGYLEMEEALRRHELDFILTNPAHYIQLRQKNGLSGVLATLVELEDGHPVTFVGGVIFRSGKRDDIARLEDLKGKILATVGNDSLGGYRLQVHDLLHDGVQMPDDTRIFVTDVPHDLVLQAVLEGRADAGLIRTGVIEAMVREGRLEAGQIHVLNRQDVPGFPYAVSTRLYPEWPFVALPHVDARIARRVAAALLSLEPDTPAARNAGIHGFAIPADYSPVEDLLRELRLPPFETVPTFTPRDVWMRYRFPLMSIAGSGVIVLFLAMLLLFGNRRLAAARREARASEDRLADILDNVGGCIYIKDRDYRYRFANRALCELIGRAPAQVAGLEDDALFDADTAARIRLDDRRVIERGERIETVETNAVAGSGQTRSYLTVKLPLRDSDGGIYALCGISTDISELKHLEAALRMSEEKLRSLYKLSPLGIALNDMSGRFLEFNPAFLNICGYREDELKGLDYWALTPSEYAGEEVRQLESLERTGRYGPYEKEYRRKDGRRIPLRLNGILVTGRDGNRYIWSIVEDISAQKAAENEIRRSNAELEQFAYAVSHDLRQPLRMVGSFLQLIVKALVGKLDEDTRQYLDFAVEGARRMDGMMLSLLEYSRIGRRSEPFMPTGSRAALDEALAFLGPEIGATGATLEVTGEWPELLASRDELTRLFQNLIGNALKYHENGRPPRVVVHGVAKPASFRAEVRDDGIGIAPDQAGRLFQVFSRLQPRARFEGAGVGLALCRRIVEHHGGCIGVESAGEGRGCTFWFELPRPGGETLELPAAQADRYPRHDGLAGQLEEEVAARGRAEASLRIAYSDLARFAEVSAHHLQEPARRLLAYARRLRSRLSGLAEDRETMLALNFIEQAATHMRNQVRDIERYLSAGESRGPVAAQEVAPLLEELKLRLARRFATLDATIESGPLPRVCLDKPRLADLLEALLENALVHRLEGVSPRIRVSGEKTDGMARLRVEDNGPGIPDEYRQRVFEVFERLHAVPAAGTGIGLAIARRIVESRGGRIHIETSVHGGCAVVFELPDESRPG